MVTKVVVFEDNDQLREMLFQMINISDGLSCTGAYANAMDLDYKIRRSQPDVVLMDIDMPGTNGVEAVKIIREKYLLSLIEMYPGRLEQIFGLDNRWNIYRKLYKVLGE